MTEIAPDIDCIDIIAPFTEHIERYAAATSNIQIMGGIGSAALTHAQTEIFPYEHRIVTGHGFRQDPQVRAALEPIRPEDGTCRDLDVLVLSADEREVGVVEKLAERTVDGQLDISVFGLHKAAQLQEQIANPFGWQAFKTFVSDRYVNPDGSMQKALFPFAVPLDKANLETWRLEIDDHEFPVAHPAATVLNYLTRSITGLRAKDAAKVDVMARQVFTAAPELREWSVDGPGRTQMNLAAILHTLRHGGSHSEEKRHLDVGGALWIEAGTTKELRDDEAFMIPEASSATQQAALKWAVIKSRGLGGLEAQEPLVKLFRNHFESMFDGITKNRAKDSAQTEAAS